jgi:hypothetical protein
MPQLAPYIPSRDANFANWSANFSTLITASPATYGLVSGDAAAIAAQETAWAAAYALVTSNATRTPTTVGAKNAAKINALALFRPYAVTISKNAGVSSANKTALGVNPNTSVPTPISAPTTNPVLTVQSALSLQQVVRYRDVLASPSVKSKPYGVIACAIYATASATAITDPTMLAYKFNATKSPFTLSWSSGDVGKQAYIAARWVTRRGLFGPWSPIIAFTVAG